MAEKAKLTGSEKVSNSLNAFLAKHTKLVIAVFVAVIVIISALAIILTSMQNKKEAQFDLLLDTEAGYSSLALMDSSSDEYAAALGSFRSNAESLVALGLDTYPGAKAQYLLADYAYENGEYQEAADLYMQIADAMSDTYLAQLCLMNAAACYDNLGSSSEALTLYNRVFDTYGEETAFAPKALYNAARIYEEQGNRDLAVATLEQLTGLYLETATGGASEYAKLAEAQLLSMN